MELILQGGVRGGRIPKSLIFPNVSYGSLRFLSGSQLTLQIEPPFFKKPIILAISQHLKTLVTFYAF